MSGYVFGIYESAREDDEKHEALLARERERIGIAESASARKKHCSNSEQNKDSHFPGPREGRLLFELNLGEYMDNDSFQQCLEFARDLDRIEYSINEKRFELYRNYYNSVCKDDDEPDLGFFLLQVFLGFSIFFAIMIALGH